MYAVVRAVTQEPLEARQVVRRGDDEDVADAREHEGADGVVDHRLVVNWQQLLADALGYRVQSGAGASGKNNAFHID